MQPNVFMIRYNAHFIETIKGAINSSTQSSDGLCDEELTYDF